MAEPAKLRKGVGAPLETRESEPLLMRAAVVPSSVNEDERSVEVTWSTGAEIARRDYWTGERFVEALSMDAKHIRLDRLRSGAPVLDSHSSWSTRSVLGVVESARIENGQGVARIRFSTRADVEAVWNDVKSGILRNISVGYAVHKWKTKRNAEGNVEKRTAVDWEPFELSVVPIPADARAQVRAYDDNDDEARGAEEIRMEEDEQTRAQTPPAITPPATNTPSLDEVRAQERKRAAEIDELCTVHGVDAGKRAKWLADGASVDAVRAAILDDMAARSKATHVSPITAGNADRDASMVRDATDALLVRAGFKVEGEGFRNFGDGSLLRMAERILESGGVNTRTMSRDELAKRALATSDYSTILNLVGAKMTRAAYDAMPLVHRTVFRRASAVDFREKHAIQVAAGAILEEVPEGGQIQRYGASAEKASYALKSYAGIIAITRKLIINDDFDAVARMSQQRGRAAAETERKLVWDFVKSNPNAPDGVAVFHADHANTDSKGAGLGVTAATLAAARKAMREQTSLDGLPINGIMRHLVCGTDTETAWDQLLNGVYVPTVATTAMTPSLRSVMLHVEPLVDGEDWYGFTDYNQCDTFEFAYLAGNEGPRVEQRNGFDVEGVELKVALDFGVGCIDHRGSYYMNGA